MDEYISRNELLKDVNSNVAEADNERCAQILESILNAPTADVVPKSEVEQLQRKYDLAVAEREANVKGFAEELEKANAEIERLKYNLKAVLDEIPETKRELTSEIFAEIDSKILAEIDLCNGVLIEFEEADEPYHRIKGEVSALCKIQDFIAELKKKYTEQCPDCKHFVGCEEAMWSGRCEDFDSVRKEDDAYEKGYHDALKDVEEMILERKNENTPKI